LARVASTFINIDATVASKTLISLTVRNLALVDVLANEVVRTHAIGKPRGARASVGIDGYAGIS
jgi:hypothetical protein